ncbi:MAG: cation diffusion facilitator family transporter [Deltaproteobacteria bacterium]|nr:cation diffusion facilitator family transporter [Deltaproteobacteria bacterium]
MSGGSKTAVYAAIVGNTVVTIAKAGAFLLTGSGAMLAEAIHSLADVGNQALLAVGMKRAHRPPDERHPFGYGREAFVWALISAVGIFFIGCGVTVAHGVHTLTSGEAHEVGSVGLALWVLLFSMVVEGASFGVAVRGVVLAARARGLGLVAHIRTTGDPFGVAVLLEDFAALLGVLIAAASLGLVQLTHDPRWDGIGSIAVGLLLGVVAVFLIAKNKAMLVGQVALEQGSVRELLASDPLIERVAVTRAAITGVDSIRVSAEVDLDGRRLAERYLAEHDVDALAAQLADPEALRAFLATYSDALLDEVGDEIDRLGEEIRQRFPQATGVDIALD